ncbi:hypothetical protein AAMO2058_000149200 [Amorphochlora amoebiformis]
MYLRRSATYIVSHVPRTFSVRAISSEKGVKGRGGGEEEDILVKKARRLRKKLEEKEVPSSSLSRMLGFGSMAAKMAFQSASARSTSSESSWMSDAVAETFASELCRMRGAALKVGQILSLQDSQNLPPPLAKALERVRTEANVMPKWQLDEVMSSSFGSNWKQQFKEFDEDPVAGASIGQVHQATTLDGVQVAVKVQYPGVARGIDADMANLQRLMLLGGFVPKGLFLDNVLATAKEELTLECDYLREAKNQERFREFLLGYNVPLQTTSKPKGYFVPAVIRDLTTSTVLTSQWIHGEPVDRLVEEGVPQEVRDSVAERMLRLVIKEVFQLRLVQSDPNWSNFLYDSNTDTLNLIDFGATNEYPVEFVSNYLKLVWACANKDRHEILKMSREIGFLCGRESPAMVKAHIEAAYIMGEPFAAGVQPFEFAKFNHGERMAEQGSVFLKERLVPPPKEVYTLHRKLFGAISTCIKLKAKIDCRKELEAVS